MAPPTPFETGGSLPELLLRSVFVLLLALASASAGAAQSLSIVVGNDHRLLRLGTGGANGTYFPIGSLLAPALSAPLDACPEPPCDTGPLLAVAQLSNGSVANVKDIDAGDLEAGLAQADVAYWAYSGTGLFADGLPNKSLRAVANLYPENIHLVTSINSGIRSVRDLEGRRVGLDEPGSGTLVDARLILRAYGLEESDLEAAYTKPQYTGEMLANGELDAFFIVAGYPAKSVAELATTAGVKLVPIDGKGAEAVVREFPYFSPSTIPAGVYDGVDETPTLAVGAQLFVSAALAPALVYRLTRALWSEATRTALRNGHPKGDAILPEGALHGVGVPLHPGAERYYRETGLLRGENQSSD